MNIQTESLQLPEPSDVQCAGTKKDGTRCPLKRAKGYGDFCRGHGMTPEQRAELSAAGHAARSASKLARETLEERGRLGLKALMAQRLEDAASDVVDRLLGIVRTGTDADALRAAEVLMARVHGRPVQPTEDVTLRLPSSLDEVDALSPDDRRALLHELHAIRALPEQ